MKIGFIFILYKTPKKEVERLRKEIKDLKIKDYKLYFIDNTFDNKGYAYGVNQGLKKAISDGCEIFFVANPDISLKSLNKKIFDGRRFFDIWGLAMRQEGKIYFGGEIDPWRMSGGLISKKPETRFKEVDFVSGSLMIIKKKVIEKIGFFDESYFLYYEEVDYCYRARKAGLKIGIDSSFIYDHFEVSKTQNSKKDFYLFKNRLKFFLKYANFKQRIREFLRIPKTLYEEIIKRPFYLNFFALNLTSILNKFFHFILFLFLINNFKPEEYAIYTLAWTHLGLFSPILDFGTTNYGLINLKNEEKKSYSILFSFRAFLSLVTFFISFLAMFFLGYKKDFLLPIFLTSFVIFSNMLYGSFLIFSSIKQRSYLPSLISLIFQTILVLSFITSIFIKKNIFNIFILTFIFYNFYSILNFYLIKKQTPFLKISFDLSSFLKIAKKSIVFLILSLLAGFYSKIDVLLLNLLKGPKEVGIYSAGYRFLDALMFLVVSYNLSSMSILSSFVKEKKLDLFLAKIKKDLIFLSLIGFGVAFGFYFFSPLIFSYLIKNEYTQSILVLKIIIFALPLILLTSVFINSLYALGKEKIIVFVFLFQLVFNFFSNYFFIPKHSFLASAWITVIGEIINLIILFLILSFYLKKEKKEEFLVSVDGGGLGVKKGSWYGNYIFSLNFIEALKKYGRYKYLVYTFENLKPKIFWSKIRLSIEELKEKKQVFLALNQAIPLYISGKVISFCHGLSYYFYPQFYCQKDLKRLNNQLKEMVKKSAYIIVSSIKVKKELIKIYPQLKSKIKVFLFGVPFDMIKKIKRKEKKYFLFVGMNHQIKNIDFIKQVFQEFKKDFPYQDYQLKIITKDCPREKLKKLYSQARALLTASYYESFNFPVLEALVSGCPVIGLRSAIIPELKKYVNVANNKKEFIDLMKTILKKPDEKMISEIKEKFSWEKYVEKIERLIK